jgi:hypothetical protein
VAALLLSVLFLLTACTGPEKEMNYGRFEGSTKAEWVRGDADERRMKLLEDVTYIDPKGKKWVAPKGYETDGASIPRVFWTFVGGPFEGAYREAAVIHDWYCDSKSEPWRDVHRIFYYAARAAGVPEATSKTLYMAVRVGGPKWGDNSSKCYSCHAKAYGYSTDKHGTLTNTPALTEKDAARIIDWVGEKNPSLEEMEAYANANYPGSKFGH